MRCIKSLSSRTLFLVTSALPLLAVAGLAGCGIGTLAVQNEPVSPLSVAGVSGHLRGGESPIVGANVYLYATTSGGYPTAGTGGTQLAMTTSNGTGDFTFSSPATCTTGQQAYMFAVGGNSGSNTVNSQIVQVAAVGPCSGLTTGTSVNIDEVSTVAAAYALSGFMMIDTSGSAPVVRIAAPANNNVATGGATAGASGAPGAAGLAHAFLNVPQLINVTTGYANTAAPAIGAATDAVQGVVPAAEINVIANILQTCVNSSGTTPPATASYTPASAAATSAGFTVLGSTDTISGTFSVAVNGTTVSTTTLTTLSALASYINGNTTLSGDSISASVSGTTLTVADAGAFTMNFAGTSIKDTPASANTSTETGCGSLFALATSRAGTAATTSAQAALNMAQNPANNVASIFGLASSSSAFQPALSAAPNDWDIAIVYQLEPVYILSPQTVAQQNPGAPYALALDANDNAYLDVLFTATVSAESGVTGASLYGYGSNGSAFMINPTSISAKEADQIHGIAVDALGNLWAAVGVNTDAVLQFQASTGNLVTTYSSPSVPGAEDVAVDRANNIWLASTRTTAAGIYELRYTAGAFATSLTASGTPAEAAYSVAIDPDQNIWFTTGDNAGGTMGTENTDTDLLVLPNSSSTGTPTYGTTLLSGTVPESVQGVTFDSSGNAYFSNAQLTSTGTTQLSEITPTYTSGVLTALPAPTTVYSPLAQVATEPKYSNFNNPRLNEVDGNGVIWTADEGTGAVFGVTTGGTAVATTPGLFPCYVKPGATACDTIGGAGQIVYYPRTVRIDSTGTMWIAYGSQNDTSNTGAVVQMFGAAAPTWPLQQLGLPGVMPH
jgi:hypothetical protein